MLTIILLLLNAAFAATGIYLFDYQVDLSVDNALVIVLSLLSGTIFMVLLGAIYEELFFITVAKKKPINSMLKHTIAKQLLSFPVYVTNRRIKVVGRENLPKEPGFSIYSNHTSMWDIPVLMHTLSKYPVAFLAKEVVETLPFIGKWTPTLGCVMIDRSNDRKAAESIIQVIRNIKGGSTMVIFPEGTRTPKLGTLIPFKDGSFKVALKSKAPLVPITIHKASNYKKRFWPLKKQITVHIHPAIPFQDLKGMKSQDLSEKVKAIIEEKL